VLIVGRGLHAPWNEGTRVINRNFARAAALHSSVRLLSVTQEQFRVAPNQVSSYGVPVEHVYSNRGYSLFGIYHGLPSLLRQLRSRDADVAHLFGVPLALAPPIQRAGVRVVAHVMTSASGPADRFLNGASGLLFDRWVDRYAVTSPALIAPLIARGVRPSKIAVVPPAIDTATFQPGDATAARLALGVDPDATLVLYLGRLSPRRFPAAEVARALGLAAAHHKRRVQFVALSPDQTYDGSENTSRYLLACSQAAEAAMRDVPGIDAEIRFGDLSDAAKVAWLQAADAVLMPFSEPEAVEPPLTLLEALACGATVVVTPAANRTGIVVDGVNGFVYSGAEQLAERLAAVWAGAAIARNFRVTAPQTVDEGFTFAATAEACARMWAQLGGTSSLRCAD